MEENPNGMAFHFSDYDVLDTIGEGSFARVYKGIHKPTQQNVAIKIFNKSNLQKTENLKILKQEMLICLTVHHPLLAPVYEIIEDEAHIAMVMELVEGGSLLNLINRYGVLSIHICQQFLQQIVFAIEYLHNVHRIVHRDLKAENILLDRYKNIRIIDFGLARHFDNDRILKTVCGSPAYVAPEVLSGQEYTEAVDLWSIGVILYACVRGKLPFFDDNIVKLLQQVTTSDPEIPPDVNPLAADLIRHLLDKNPDTRLTIPELKAHPFFNGAISPYDNPRYSLLPLPTEAPDVEVLHLLASHGIDINSVIFSLQNRKSDSGVTGYKIARQVKIAFLMKDECQSKKIESTQSEALLDRSLVSFRGMNKSKQTFITPAFGYPKSNALIQQRHCNPSQNNLILGLNSPNKTNYSHNAINNGNNDSNSNNSINESKGVNLGQAKKLLKGSSVLLGTKEHITGPSLIRPAASGDVTLKTRQRAFSTRKAVPPIFREESSPSSFLPTLNEE